MRQISTKAPAIDLTLAIYLGLASCSANSPTAAKFIPVGKLPIVAVVSLKRQAVYVTNHDSDSVSVIDTRSNTVISTVTGCAGPYDAALAPDEATLYVTCQNSAAVGVFDTQTNRWVEMIPLHGGTQPGHISITPDGKKAYVSIVYGDVDRFQGNVNVIDIRTKTVIATINDTPTALQGIGCAEGNALTPDGKHLYLNTQCATSGGKRSYDPIFIIDVARDVVVREIPPEFPNVGTSIAVTPDGRQVWAGGGDACSAPWPEYDNARKSQGTFRCGPPGGNPTTIFDSKTNRSITQIFYGGPLFISFSPNAGFTRFAYLATDSELLVIDSTTFRVTQHIPVAGSTGKLAFSEDGKYAYTAVPQRNAVALISVE